MKEIIGFAKLVLCCAGSGLCDVVYHWVRGFLPNVCERERERERKILESQKKERFIHSSGF